MFAASRFIRYCPGYKTRAFIMKSGDGSIRFHNDLNDGLLDEYLKKVLLFTCFEPQNHMRSLYGSDGRFYRNEICLDTTHGPTLASNELDGFNANKSETEMLNLWRQILASAKTMPKYDSNLTYGMYHIDDELNTFDVVRVGRKNKRVYHNPKLNGDIKSLKNLIKDYYVNEIVDTLFKYEFLK